MDWDNACKLGMTRPLERREVPELMVFGPFATAKTSESGRNFGGGR